MQVSLMPLVSLTVMLWLLWSESLRKRPISRIFYFVRTLLYLAMTGVLIFNLVRYPEMFTNTGRVTTIVAAIVGVVGAAFFFRKMSVGWKGASSRTTVT